MNGRTIHSEDRHVSDMIRAPSVQRMPRSPRVIVWTWPSRSWRQPSRRQNAATDTTRYSPDSTSSRRTSAVGLDGRSENTTGATEYGDGVAVGAGAAVGTDATAAGRAVGAGVAVARAASCPPTAQPTRSAPVNARAPKVSTRNRCNVETLSQAI